MPLEYAMGPIRIRPSERRVFLHGRPVALGARAFDLLLALVEHRDRVVGKGELLALVWPGLVVEEGNLSVQVSALRKALGEPLISTVPGRGYRLTAPVVEHAAADAPPPEPSHVALAAKAESPSSGWLPAPMTPLLGRAAALAETQALLQSNRCLTLVGAGGSGKTRLALALAEAVRGRYAGGVWWVSLDALSEPALLAQAVVSAVGAADLRTPPLQALTQRLSGLETLLVLDNCEHLVEGCAAMATRLLRELPHLHLLNTSRESLRIDGEVVWSVPPLAVPDAPDAPPEQLRQAQRRGAWRWAAKWRPKWCACVPTTGAWWPWPPMHRAPHRASFEPPTRTRCSGTSRRSSPLRCKASASSGPRRRRP
jgi:DNA-binding winged helix-turn-helix (wHTH) protein